MAVNHASPTASTPALWASAFFGECEFRTPPPPSPLLPPSSATTRPSKNKGRPKGVKDSYKRLGTPNPLKGVSKYSNITKPPYMDQAGWDKLTFRTKQRKVRGYEIDNTNDGIYARNRCNRCRKNDGWTCRFYRSHRRGQTCGNCERVGKTCTGGTRVDDEPGDDDDHLPAMPPRRQRGPGDDGTPAAAAAKADELDDEAEEEFFDTVESFYTAESFDSPDEGDGSGNGHGQGGHIAAMEGSVGGADASCAVQECSETSLFVT